MLVANTLLKNNRSQTSISNFTHPYIWSIEAFTDFLIINELKNINQQSMHHTVRQCLRLYFYFLISGENNLIEQLLC